HTGKVAQSRVDWPFLNPSPAVLLIRPVYAATAVDLFLRVSRISLVFYLPASRYEGVNHVGDVQFANSRTSYFYLGLVYRTIKPVEGSGTAYQRVQRRGISPECKASRP